MKNILITVCARGGSKGVSDKNIRLLNGKSLIGYTIETAQRFKSLMANRYYIDITLSTDSERIKFAAAKFGLLSDYQRPDEFATDKAGKASAIKDVLIYTERTLNKEYDFIIDLDVTAPFRTLNDLSEGLCLMENDNQAMTLFSVSEPHRNPYFNMVEKKENGYVKLVKPLDGNILSRQAAPKVYDMNASFYIFRKSFFSSSYQTVITDKSIAYLMPHICFDIDNELDFEIMELLLRENKLDFEFNLI